MVFTPPQEESALRLFWWVVGPDRSQRVEIPPGQELLIGRGKDAGVRLKEDAVAPAHLRTRRVEDDAVELEVVAGARGAKLNDIEFSGKVRARVGDQLSLGATVLILQSHRPLPASPASPVLPRAQFEQLLEEEAERSRRTHRPLLLALLHLRGGGDQQEARMNAVRQELGGSARWGALGANVREVLIPDLTPKQRTHWLERLEAVGARAGKVRLGFASFPEDGTDAATLMESALLRVMSGEGSAHALPPDALVALHHVGEEPLFLDPVMVRLVSVLDSLSSSPSPLLLCGERGSGKELLAAMVHQRSGRSGPLVKVDVAGLSEGALEAALLGVSSGKAGALERAAKGTLLLTHGEALSEKVQHHLEAALKEGKASRMEGGKAYPVDVHLVATSGAEPEAAALGSFIPMKVWVPALRDRHEEVLPLAEHFLSRCRKSHGRPSLVLGEEARVLLERHLWPGNLRELRLAIERAVLVSQSDEIRPDDLPPSLLEALGETAPPAEGAEDFRTSLRAVEKDVLLKALARTRWNVSQAAKMLGLPRRTVIYRMSKLGLRRPERS